MAVPRKRRPTQATTPKRPKQIGVTLTPAAFALVVAQQLEGESVGTTISRLVERLDALEHVLHAFGQQDDIPRPGK